MVALCLVLHLTPTSGARASIYEFSALSKTGAGAFSDGFYGNAYSNAANVTGGTLVIGGNPGGNLNPGGSVSSQVQVYDPNLGWKTWIPGSIVRTPPSPSSYLPSSFPYSPGGDGMITVQTSIRNTQLTEGAPVAPMHENSSQEIKSSSFTQVTDANGYSAHVANIFFRSNPNGTLYLPNESGLNYFSYNSPNPSHYKSVAPELTAYVSETARQEWIDSVLKVQSGSVDPGTLDPQIKVVATEGGEISLTNGAAFSGTVCISSGTLIATDLSQAKVAMTDFETTHSGFKRTLSPHGDEIGTLKVKGLQLGYDSTLEMTLGSNNQSDTIQLLGNDFTYGGINFRFTGDDFAPGVFTLLKGVGTPIGTGGITYTGNFAGIDDIEFYMAGNELKFAARQISELSRAVGWGTYNHEYFDSIYWATKTENGTRNKGWIQGKDAVVDTNHVDSMPMYLELNRTIEIDDFTYRNGEAGTRLILVDSSSSRSLALVTDESTVSVNAGLTLQIDTAISGTGALRKAGAGLLVVNGDAAHTGGTIIDSGTVQIGTGGTTGQLAGDIENNTTLVVNRYDAAELSGDISGSGRLIQSGSGMLTLSGNNSYTGGTIVNSGGLNINSPTALGTGRLIIGGTAPVLNNTSGAPVTLTAVNAQEWNANFTVLGSNDLDMGTGAVAMNAACTVTVNTGKFTVGGRISAAKKNLGLTKKGNGTMVLAGNSAYTGATTITAGTLQLGDGGTHGSVAGKIVNNSALVLDRSDAYALPNVISGKGTVTYNDGTAIVSGANSYSGATTLNGGRLVSGNTRALGRGDLILNDGILATGSGQDILAAGRDLLWDGDAHIALTLTGDRYSEKLVVKRNLRILDDGPLTFDFTATFLPEETYSFLVMTVARGFGDITAEDFAFTSTNNDFTGNFRIKGTKLYFDGIAVPVSGGMAISSAGLTAADSAPGTVPEPSTALLLVAGLTGMLASRRRRA